MRYEDIARVDFRMALALRGWKVNVPIAEGGIMFFVLEYLPLNVV